MMAKAFLRDARVDPGCQECCRVTVPKLMEGDSGKVGGGDESGEPPAHPIGSERASNLVRENPLAMLPRIAGQNPLLELGGPVLLQDLNGVCIYLDRSPGPTCLGFTHADSAIYENQSPADRDCA